jgi:hypothetical protein
MMKAPVCGRTLMTKSTSYRLSGKGYVVNVLRREIPAARPNVTSVKHLMRPTSQQSETPGPEEAGANYQGK